jgi:hypothetical protein
LPQVNEPPPRNGSPGREAELLPADQFNLGFSPPDPIADIFHQAKVTIYRLLFTQQLRPP